MNHLFFQNELSDAYPHPLREQLLLFVDGELAPREAEQVQAHLDACWACRVKMGRIEEAIGDIIKFDEAVLQPHLTSLSVGGSGFDARLNRLAAESGAKPRLARLRGWFGNLRYALGQFSFTPQLAGRFAAALLTMVIVAALLFQAGRVRVVSASELLRRAVTAHEQELKATTQPVVYQKLQLRRKAAQSLRETSATLELWRDVEHARSRRALDDWFSVSTTRNAQAQRVVSARRPVPALLVELENVARANRLDAGWFLSAAAYQAWRDSVGQKDEQVVQTSLPGGVEVLTLKTSVRERVGVDQLVAAELVVRVRDWHPVAQRLRVSTAAGQREYEFTELAFQIVSLNAVDAAVFADPTVAAVSPAPTLSPALAPTAAPVALGASSPLPVAPAELEVEVLERLNQANALLGEQLTVTRTADGRLRIEGLVETDARKGELLAALKAVAGNPAVKVEISTVAEAQARQTPSAPRNIIVQDAQVTQTAIPVEAELRSHFASTRGLAGERLEQELQRFSGQICSRSSRARAHALALKQISERFTLAQLQTLDPAARQRWQALLSEHAQGYRRELQQLRQQLQPIFAAAAAGTVATADARGSAEELKDDINHLFKLAADNDQALCQSFSVSTEAVTGAAVKQPEFWRAVGVAENLAARIAGVQ